MRGSVQEVLEVSTLHAAPFILQGTLQEVIGWGQLGWKLHANVNGPVQCKTLASLGVTQIVCSEKGFLVLSRSGAVYLQNYKSTTLVSSGIIIQSLYRKRGKKKTLL